MTMMVIKFKMVMILFVMTIAENYSGDDYVGENSDSDDFSDDGVKPLVDDNKNGIEVL